MQITNIEVLPVELSLRLPYQTAYHPKIDRVTVVFVRVETRQGPVAWGCAAFDPALTDETLEGVVRACRACAARVRLSSGGGLAHRHRRTRSGLHRRSMTGGGGGGAGPML